jgi:hypothetical protein
MMSSQVETIEPDKAAAGWRNWIQNAATLSTECQLAVYAALRIRRSLRGNLVADHPELSAAVLATINPLIMTRMECITYMAVRSTMEELGQQPAAPAPMRDAVAMVSTLALIANAIECEIRKILRAALPQSDAWRTVHVGVCIDACALLQVPADRGSLIRLIEQSEEVG